MENTAKLKDLREKFQAMTGKMVNLKRMRLTINCE